MKPRSNRSIVGPFFAGSWPFDGAVTTMAHENERKQDKNVSAWRAVMAGSSCGRLWWDSRKSILPCLCECHITVTAGEGDPHPTWEGQRQRAFQRRGVCVAAGDPEEVDPSPISTPTVSQSHLERRWRSHLVADQT